jgi:hypothetical protein
MTSIDTTVALGLELAAVDAPAAEVPCDMSWLPAAVPAMVPADPPSSMLALPPPPPPPEPEVADVPEVPEVPEAPEPEWR